MKKLAVYLFFLFFISQSALLSYSSDPKNFIYELINDAIGKLSSKDLSEDEKILFIEKIAKDNVDINALGLYTLGELRKSSNKEDIANYQNSFEKYFLKSITSRLSEYSSSKFDIVEENKKSDKYTIVSSTVTPNDGGPKVKIDWRVYTKNEVNRP